MNRPSPELVKTCCAAAYQSDVVALVLGEAYHPGGTALTRRLARSLNLGPDSRVLDVASGPGTTACLLADEFGCQVQGVDLGEDSVRRAELTAARAGLTGLVRFQVADAESIPFPANSFDAVVCECALCTFPDKERAVAEFSRVLRPSGRIGITDVTIAPGGLPDELADLTGWVACLADARPADGYVRLLTDAGMTVLLQEDHGPALAEMVDRIDARLRALRMVAGTLPAGVDVDRILALVGRAAGTVADGTAGYTFLVARNS